MRDEYWYSWRGTDEGGYALHGKIRTGNRPLAYQLLRDCHINISYLSKGLHFRYSKITQTHLIDFFQQLAFLLKANMVLLQAIQFMLRNNSPLQPVLIQTKLQLLKGKALSTVLINHPQLFTKSMCQVIAIGEQTGNLPNMLTQLGEQLKKKKNFKQALYKASLYPGILVLTACAVLTVLMQYVIPQFESLFSDSGAKLPLLTQLVLQLAHHFKFVIDLLIGVSLIIWLAHKNLHRYPVLQIRYHRLILTNTLFGKIMWKMEVIKWSRSLSLLLEAGEPLTQALQQVSTESNNAYFQTINNQLHANVIQGQRLTPALRQFQFPHFVSEMVGIGEEAGTLAPMLTNINACFESEIAVYLEKVSLLLEPLIILILGVLIGSLVIAMYLPVFQLGNVI